MMNGLARTKSIAWRKTVLGADANVIAYKLGSSLHKLKNCLAHGV